MIEIKITITCKVCGLKIEKTISNDDGSEHKFKNIHFNTVINELLSKNRFAHLVKVLKDINYEKNHNTIMCYLKKNQGFYCVKCYEQIMINEQEIRNCAIKCNLCGKNTTPILDDNDNISYFYCCNCDTKYE